MESLSACEHLHELFDAALARLRSLGVTNPIEDGVAVLAAQPPEHLASSWLGGERHLEIGGHLMVAEPA